MALTILCLEYKKHCTEWVQSGGLRGGWVLGLQMDQCAKTIISLFFSRAALHHFFSQPPTPPPASTPVQGMQASPAPALILIPLGIFNKQCISYASALYPWVCRKKNQEMISRRLGECLLASTVVNSTGMLPAFYFWTTSFFMKVQPLAQTTLCKFLVLLNVGRMHMKWTPAERMLWQVVCERPSWV